MVTVRRSNVLLTIKDSELNRYLSLGYSLVNSKGEVVKESIPNDISSLKDFYIRNKSKVEEYDSLKHKIIELEEKIKKLEATKKEKPVKEVKEPTEPKKSTKKTKPE